MSWLQKNADLKKSASWSRSTLSYVEVDPHSWDVGAVEFAFNASAGPGQCRPVKIRPRSGLCFLAIVITIIIPAITNTTIIIDI